MSPLSLNSTWEIFVRYYQAIAQQKLLCFNVLHFTTSSVSIDHHCHFIPSVRKQGHFKGILLYVLHTEQETWPVSAILLMAPKSVSLCAAVVVCPPLFFSRRQKLFSSFSSLQGSRKNAFCPYGHRSVTLFSTAAAIC